MENIEYLEDAYGNPTVLIDRGNGEFTSMPKPVYDKQQAALAEK